MSRRVILLDTDDDGRGRAALLVDGRLEDLLVDPPAGDTAPAPGEIYRARVDRLVPKMHGAFVRLTPEHTGFLREAKGLKEGRGVLVQVAAHAEPGKAMPVTPNVLHKGPRLIYTPHAPGVNVSRRIRDAEERARLTAAVAEAFAGAGDLPGGVIVRTSAEGADTAELRRELAALLAAAEAAARAMHAPAPLDGPVGGGSRAATLAIREWAFPGPAVLRATRRAHDALAGALADALADALSDSGAAATWGSESLRAALERHDGGDLLDQHGVREEIERLRAPRADLPSGGWMAIEATRAMVTVDVNTAAEFSGGAGLTANIEAARALPRELRLRGLGGQVTVDFAPLKKTDRKRLEEALKAAFRRDPVETTLAGWTPLGHVELQRKRERRPLAELLD